jgi:FHS family Na+ dependent glucose MFS transporter 1
MSASSSTSAPQTKPLVATAAYYLAFIVFGMSIAVEGPSLPVLAQHTSSRLDQISLIFVFGSLGYLLGSWIGGWGYDRFPGHRFMGLSMLLIAALVAFIPVASSLWMLLAIVLVLGLGKGALDVGCNLLLQWVHGRKAGPFLNGLHFCFGVGSFIGPLILAVSLKSTAEIYWVFWTIALLSLPLAVWFWVLPDPRHPARAAESGASSVPLLPILLLVATFFLYVGAEVGFGNWIYTYAVTLGVATTITAAYLTSVFWGLFTLGRLLGVWVSTRLRAQTILFLDLAGCLASLALIMFGKNSTALLWAGTAGLGLSMASMFPTILMFASERWHVTGSVTGWFLVGSGGGGMFLPWLIGQTFVATGPQSMMLVVFTAVLAKLLIFSYLVSLKHATVASAA